MTDRIGLRKTSHDFSIEFLLRGYSVVNGPAASLHLIQDLTEICVVNAQLIGYFWGYEN